MAFSKQFFVYSVDTDAFYYEDEFIMSKSMNTLRKKRNDAKKNGESTKELSKTISDTKDEFKNLLDRNSGKIRELNPSFLSNNNVVSMFDSTLTRTLGLNVGELNEDIIIVKTYFFQVLKDIVLNGFTLNGERYIYFSSSAGQVRLKKSVYIKESLWEKYESSLMCGLTFDKINKKGGINQNKFMAYLSLLSSATDVWEGFDMNKAIVVDDMTTTFSGVVDFIDEKTYEITEGIEMDVTIDTTDGCGMMLPSVSKKNKMMRAPWIKGNLVCFDFKAMASENGGSGDVCDIYGKKYNIFKDDIQVIFTKSQFKLWKFYDSWEDYLLKFHDNNCEIGYCNEEEDVFKDKEINYQMLQTLYDMSDEDIERLVSIANKKLERVAKTKEGKFEVIGATESNIYKSPFQEAVSLYPELLKDPHTKKMISNTKKSIIKKFKSGKIPVDKGHYTFIVPDLYGFCQHLFFGQFQKGLLMDGEVCCNLFNDGDEIDILRSPHLSLEHCVRKNVRSEEITRWFTTDAMYISSHDLISRILQNDFDGDQVLGIFDNVILPNAKRLSKGVKPLFYHMKKAEDRILNNYSMYEGLVNAYKANNIGVYSNNISKVWNNITEENIKESMSAIKLLCMESNFNIDLAKTLYMPTRPKEIDETIKDVASGKLPNFFIYAKDKEEDKVEKANNSVMNKIARSIINPRITFEESEFENFDYTMLLSGKTDLSESTKKISYHYDKFLKYRSILSKYNQSNDINNQSFLIKTFRDDFKSLNYEFNHMIDSLVIYLFKEKPNKEKSIFWDAFGDVILNNLKENISNSIRCEVCGKLTRKKSNKMRYCKECAYNIQLELTRNYKERIKKSNFG